jgi:internalin A
VYIFLFHVDFTLEDIMVSRSLRQGIDPTNPKLPDTPFIGPLRKATHSSLYVPDNKELSVPTAAWAFSELQQSTLTEKESKEVSVPISVGFFSKQRQSSLSEPENKEVSVPTAAGAFGKLQQSLLHEPESKEVSVPTAAGAFRKLQQSLLHEPETKEVSATTASGAFSKLQQSSLNEPENKEVSVPTTAGTERRLEQSSLHDPENKKVSVPSAASVVRKPSIIDSLKFFFGVRKEVNEIKISVKPEKVLKMSGEVGKKKLHWRKLVPVIIWDFGGKDVFHSTHQTFLTYRAIYMLVLDGSRTLDEHCPFAHYLPGKGGAKTQRGSSFFIHMMFNMF